MDLERREKREGGGENRKNTHGSVSGKEFQKFGSNCIRGSSHALLGSRDVGACVGVGMGWGVVREGF